MNRRCLQTIALLLISLPLVSNLWSQSPKKFSDWGPVVSMGRPLNTVYDEQAAVLTKDEKTIFFTSNRPGSINGSRDIWAATRSSKYARWNTPVNLGPTINSGEIEYVRSITSDGRMLLFQSERSGGHGQADIWVVIRENPDDVLGWGEPINLGSKINTEHAEIASNYLLSDSGRIQKLLFSSTKPGGFGGGDIYESTISRDGFELAVNVVELNSPSIETCFWVRDDGLEIIFTSNRPNVTGDRTFDDLWIASRKSVFEPWSTPVNLGPNINIDGFRDVGPYVTTDGLTFLTSSDRPGGMAPGTFDLYMSTRQELKD